MKTDSKVLQLISKINARKISPEDVSKILDSIEKNGGTLDILYDVEDRKGEEYYEELFTNAKLGVYNRDSLMKMAEIKYEQKTDSENRKIFAICIGSGTVLILAIVLIVSIVRGRS